jgi:hypothetical protein
MRKHLLCAIAFTFISILCNAQISKGSILLGGNFSLSNRKTENSVTPNYFEKNQNFSITPSVGIALSQNTIVGTGLLYKHSSAKSSGSEQKSNNYGISVFARQYFSLGKSFYLFGEGSLGYIMGKQQFKQNNTVQADSKSKNINLIFYPGIAYALNKRFQLEAGLSNLLFIGYDVSHSKSAGYPDTYTTKIFNVGTSLSGAAQLTVGFRFIITK